VRSTLPEDTTSSFESGYQRFLAGDERGPSVFATDAVLHVPGGSRVAGTFSGEEQIRAYLRSLGELSDGTVRIELEGVSISGPYVVAWQHLTAARDGRTLDDHQCLRVLMRKGRAQEAWLYPTDLKAHDAFWGGSRRPLFTPEDRESLADAFKQARPQPPGTSGIIALILAMIGASVAIYAYNTLNQWRRPVAALVSTQSLATLRHLTMVGPRDDSVSWIIDQAYVERLAVSGAEPGAVEILLPLDGSECPELAQHLEGTCFDGVVTVGTPVDLTWSSSQFLSSNGQRIYGKSLDLAPSDRTPEEGGLALFTQTTSRPSLCFNSPQGETTLLASRGTGGDPYTHPFDGTETAVTCEAALSLVVGSVGAPPPTVELRNIDSLTLSAKGPTASLEGLSGQVVLTPGGTTALGSPTVLNLETSASQPLEASLDLGSGLQSLKVHSPATTSVLTESGELVPSEWQRDPGILVPLLGGFVGVFVVTPLGVAVQGLMAALRRGEQRFGAWRRGRRGGRRAR
jgi:ketosteroid isomerase-like protein